MRIPRTRHMQFRKFVKPFQPPPTHKIDDWGRIVELGVPVPKMPGEAPRPALPAPDTAALSFTPATPVAPESPAGLTPPPGAAPRTPARAPALDTPPGETTCTVSPADAARLLHLNAKLRHAAPDLPPLFTTQQADHLAKTGELPPPGTAPHARPAARREAERDKPRQRRRASRGNSRRGTGAARPGDSSLEHHARHCTICQHPQREDIEAEFMDWFYPRQIACDYDVEKRALYRHAHATGLYAQRDRNVRVSLAALIERCHGAQVSGDTVVRAVRAYTRVNSEGQWIEPPTRVTVSPGGAFLSGPSAMQALPSKNPAMEPAVELLPAKADE